MRRSSDAHASLAWDAPACTNERWLAMRVCVVGASGKLGRYIVEQALARGHEVVGVCRAQSVRKLDAYGGRIEIVPGATNDPGVIRRAVAGCGGVLVVLVPWGIDHYASGTAQAVVDNAEPRARLVFPCGRHISRDGRDVYSRKFRWKVKAMGWLARRARMVDRVDFALFMVEALTNDDLIHQAPAIVGCQTPSALDYAAGGI
jgi:NADPH:quinone reductase-like Zn-dependent oxidoreductase